MRNFEYATSLHRPDGKMTIWITAKRDFSYRELVAKQHALVSKLIAEGFEDIITGIGEELSVKKSSEMWTIYYSRQFEIVIPPDLKDILLGVVKSLFGGKWLEKKHEWKSP